MHSLEVNLENEIPSRTRFGRNRFLVFIGSGLVAAATKLAMATPAYAHPTPFLCHDAPGCHCCSGSSCCESGCTAVSGACESGGQCWTVAVDVGGGCYDLYVCCDWTGPAHGFCMCRSGPSRVC
jgi:hypothetical protein